MDILSALIHPRHPRKIGLVVPNIVISEVHTDKLEITTHPVEKPQGKGAAFIADHAYRTPSTIVMKIGFSGGGSLVDFADTTTTFIGSLGIDPSPKEIYQNLLDLQNKREPVDVVTGKRLYSNMLISSLEVTTDKESENVLLATVTLQEVIMTSTGTLPQAADKADMVQGASTSAVQNSGTKTIVPFRYSPPSA